jgi:hypothetical protein
VQELDGFGYDCFFEGQSRLWRITGDCWDSLYEFHKWSNVMCLLRTDIWMKSIHRYIVTKDKLTEIRKGNNKRISSGTKKRVYPQHHSKN